MSEASSLRQRIIGAIQAAMASHPAAFAGWEGGSAAFGALDRYSDIDLTFLVDREVSTDELYNTAEAALEQLSPIAVRYQEPPGPWEGATHRYYRLADADEYLLIDLGLLRLDAPDHFLETERHGNVIPLFDKGDWLRPRPLDAEALQAKANKRLEELRTWFPLSQNFVVKSILRGQLVDATARYWAYTLRPLVELLRMRDCPNRWDFGMRYLDRDLAPEAHARVCALVFVHDLEDLRAKHTEAAAWGNSLLDSMSLSALSAPAE
jgi:hypothetical protein